MRLVTFRDSPHSTRVGILENEQVHGLAAETMIEWLNGEGRVRTGTCTRSRTCTCWRPCRLRRLSAISSLMRSTWRPAGGCAGPRSRRPGTRSRSSISRIRRRSAGRATASSGPTGCETARLRARDRRGHRRGQRDRRLHAAERLERARSADAGDDGRARPGEGQGLRDEPRADAGDARRAALRGRAAAPGGHRASSTARRSRAATPPSSTTPGRRSSSTPRATRSCAPAT